MKEARKYMWAKRGLAGVLSLSMALGGVPAIAYAEAVEEIPLQAQVVATDISGATVEVLSPQTYSGVELTPEPVVVLGVETLQKGIDYTVSYQNNKNVGTATVTVTGKGNYTGTASTTFTIQKKTIEYVGGLVANDKVYDGNSTATIDSSHAELQGKAEGDDLGIEVPIGVFRGEDPAIVGVGKPVEVLNTGISLTGEDVANYELSDTPSYNAMTANITPKPVRVANVLASTTETKTYDGTTEAPAALFDTTKAEIDGLLVAHVGLVRVTATGMFVDKNAGQNKPVTLTLGLAPVDAGDENQVKQAANYVVDTAKSQTKTTATIDPLGATISWGATTSWSYDSSSHAPEASVSNKVKGDSVEVSVSGAQTDVGTYEGDNAAVADSLTGTDAPNYVLTEPYSKKAFSITKTTAAISANPEAATDLTYNGDDQSLLSSAGSASQGVMQYSIDGGTNWSTDVPTGKNAGSYTVTYRAYGDPNNYDPSATGSCTVTIDPKPVTVSFTTESVEYNATSRYPELQVDDKVTGDTVSASLTNQPTENIAVRDDYTISKDNIQLVNTDGNYVLSGQQDLTYAITPKAITVTAGTLKEREYNGTTAVPVTTGAPPQPLYVAEQEPSLTGVCDSDIKNVTLLAVPDGAPKYPYEYGEKGVGERTASIAYQLSGDKADNYTLQGANDQGIVQVSTSGTITKKTVVISGIGADDKEYDGTTDATINTDELAVMGAIKGDDVTLSSTTRAEFANANVGENKTVSLSGIALGGTDASNYNLNLAGSQTETTANITKAKSKVDLKANDLTYNGSEQVLATATASLDEAKVLWYVGNTEPKDSDWSENAPTAKIAGTYKVWCKTKDDESEYKNYVYEGEPVSKVVKIAAAPLTVKADAKSKVEGAADPALTYQVSGLKGSDKSADVVTGALTRDAGEAPGTYAIKQGGVKSTNPNYAIKYAGANLTINALPDTVAISPAVAHVQKVGDVTYGPDAPFFGTTGKSRRVEALQLSLSDQPLAGSIEYRSHVQKQGWETEWAKDGSRSGTTGKSRRLEAVAIRLTPGSEMEKHYDVYYRMHVQKVGWMGWAKNGEYAGTAGMSRRCEAYQVVVVKKGAPAPGATYRGVTQDTDQAYISRG